MSKTRKGSGKRLTKAQRNKNCDKRKYTSSKAAEAELKFHAMMREHGYQEYRCIRAYPCINCGGLLHLTSQPE